MRQQTIAQRIEDESERQVIARLGYHPSTWYYGGPSHNDYRLTAVVEDGCVRVNDGNAYEIYDGDGTRADVAEYVSNWLDAIWPAGEEED